MTYKICYWDAISKAQKERDSTPSETAEIDARIAAPAPVPQSISRFQALAALQKAGLLATAQSAVNASANPLVAIAFNNAQTFERNSPTVALIAAGLSLTSAQIDQLFTTAATLTA